MDSYKELASYYDMLISDDDAQNLYMQFTLKHLMGNHILELGCGSGILADKLLHANSSLSIVATDLSKDMIQVAKENYSEDTIQFEVMDMTKNKYVDAFDTIICFCDSLNYILGIENVEKVFQGAYDALKEHGVWIFDMHSLDRLSEFKEEYDESYILGDLEYSWHISTHENYIEQLLRVWDDSIVPTYFFEEHHKQEVYSPSIITKLLESIGFKVQVYTDFNYEGIQSGEKYFYICEK